MTLSPKEEFFWKDRFVKGLSLDKTIRITVVKTTEIAETARVNHELSPVATVLLGRALTGAMLMAAQLKGEERVRLVLHGDGPIGTIVAEANYVGEVRGYVDHPQVDLDWASGAQLHDAVGKGTLEFAKSLYNEAKPITGIVEITDGTITGDLAHYIEQSEQIPSMVALDVQINDEGKVISAAGLLVQAMPGADLKNLEHVQQQVLNLPPLGLMLERGLYIDDIMVNAMGDVKVQEIDRTPVHFYCRCNKDRFVDALALLHVDELAAMKDDNQELVCQYCNKSYLITAEEIATLHRSALAKLN
jgi:molecular chaperone Hsp33